MLAKRFSVSNPADFYSHILKYPHLVVSSIDPGNVTGDEGIFYERIRGVMIARTIRGMSKDISLAIFNLNMKHWT